MGDGLDRSHHGALVKCPRVWVGWDLLPRRRGRPPTTLATNEACLPRASLPQHPPLLPSPLCLPACRLCLQDKLHAVQEAVRTELNSLNQVQWGCLRRIGRRGTSSLYLLRHAIAGASRPPYRSTPHRLSARALHHAARRYMTHCSCGPCRT